MPRLGQKILERRQQIRTQTSPFLPDSFEVPPFEQPRKKSLSEILRFLRFIALASDEPVKWPPVGSAKLFQRRLSRRRFALALPAPRSNAWWRTRAARLRPLRRVARSQANIVIISFVLCKAKLSIQLPAVVAGSRRSQIYFL